MRVEQTKKGSTTINRKLKFQQETLLIFFLNYIYITCIC